MKLTTFAKVLALVTASVRTDDKNRVEEIMKSENISSKDVFEFTEMILAKKDLGFREILAVEAVKAMTLRLSKMMKGEEVQTLPIPKEMLMDLSKDFSNIFYDELEKEEPEEEPEEEPNFLTALKDLAKALGEKKSCNDEDCKKVEEAADAAAKYYSRVIRKNDECLVPNGLTERILAMDDHYKVKEETFHGTPFDIIEWFD